MKFFTILNNDLKLQWENRAIFPKICKFSNGGQYFAICSDENTSVYTSWDTSLVLQFEGKFIGLSWNYDDTNIVTTSRTGECKTWTFENMDASSGEEEAVGKSLKRTSKVAKSKLVNKFYNNYAVAVNPKYFGNDSTSNLIISCGENGILSDLT